VGAREDNINAGFHADCALLVIKAKTVGAFSCVDAAAPTTNRLEAYPAIFVFE
jgi:hypothetical protein